MATRLASAVAIDVDASSQQRMITRQLLGQGLWYSWQAYAWDSESQRTWPGALRQFETLGMGILGHYPGVGVIAHDFHWQNMIGPVDKRTDPTPRQASFDAPLYLEFGPDEYGRFLEEYRSATGLDVEGSIQINIVNGLAEEAADWVEYMNAPHDGSNPGGGVDWAAVRAANGHPQPYRVRYWELGNEPHFTASRIGHLTATEYVARIREFVPLMKERDPSIEVMGYVNPFSVGDPGAVGTAAEDIRGQSGLTWSQAVIRDAGDHLDYLYFHWFGGWNDRQQDDEQLVTSMYSGLIPLLDRLAQDVKDYAPSSAARTRLQRVFIPEWNVYGGWFRPVSRGTALLGAIAYSRTLHVFASRSEIYGAEHLALFAPYPEPAMAVALTDIREGYFVFRGKEDGSTVMGTALAVLARLWSRAFEPNVVQATARDVPVFDDNVPVLDVTALRSPNGDELNLVITNAGHDALDIQIRLSNFSPLPDGARLTVSGGALSDNNDWQRQDSIVLQERSFSPGDSSFLLTIPAHSIEAVLLGSS